MKWSQYIGRDGNIYPPQEAEMDKYEGRIANATGLTKEQYLEYEFIVANQGYLQKLAALGLAERIKKGLTREDLGFDAAEG